MENNPDMESFERFIKQQSDDFRMYPTKRVWYSLYNNLHPGRKWPSISMCIVLLTTLFLIGFLNTNNNHNLIATQNNDSQVSNSKLSGRKLSTLQNDIAVSNSQNKETAAEQSVVVNIPATNFSNQPGVNLTSSVSPDNLNEHTASLKNTKAVNSSFIIQSKISSSANENLIAKTGEIKIDETVAVNSNENIGTTLTPSFGDEIQSEKTQYADQNSTNYTNEIKTSALKKLPDNLIQTASFSVGETNVPITTELLSSAAAAGNEMVASQEVVTSIVDKSWIENYALYNKPAPKKWKGKLAWQAYFTPSVSYRKLFNNAAGKNIGNLSGAINTSSDVSLSKEVTQSASIGLEAGVALQYPIFKGVKIKAGLQLNYTRYNIGAFENSHPTITSLEMLSKFDGKPYELYKTTAYSNNSGLIPVTLHSQTLQLSLPVGADIKLAGNDLFEWYAGASIQPTIVFAASSYLISTDRRNYVKDNSMLNHFNMNAGFETYISFKSAGGLVWQVGPQFRKQLYSSSSRLYTVEERIVGYGLKIGFVKKL